MCNGMPCTWVPHLMQCVPHINECHTSMCATHQWVPHINKCHAWLTRINKCHTSMCATHHWVPHTSAPHDAIDECNYHKSPEQRVRARECVHTRERAKERERVRMSDREMGWKKRETGIERSCVAPHKYEYNRCDWKFSYVYNTRYVCNTQYLWVEYVCNTEYVIRMQQQIRMSRICIHHRIRMSRIDHVSCHTYEWVTSQSGIQWRRA